MLEIRSLITVLPLNALGGAPITCNSCRHFEHDPAVQINGKLVTCSSPEVGRKAAARACESYAPNPMALVRPATAKGKKARDALLEGIERAGLLFPSDGYAQNSQLLLDAIAFLAAAATTTAKGKWIIGMPATANAGTPDEVTGKLMLVNNMSGTAVLLVPDRAGSNFTFQVALGSLTQTPRKIAKEDDRLARQQAVEAKKIAARKAKADSAAAKKAKPPVVKAEPKLVKKGEPKHKTARSAEPKAPAKAPGRPPAAKTGKGAAKVAGNPKRPPAAKSGAARGSRGSTAK